jgi:hypothetical protein
MRIIIISKVILSHIFRQRKRIVQHARCGYRVGARAACDLSHAPHLVLASK